MNKQQKRMTPEQRRKLIMTSRAYKMWWAARSTQDPIPSDPYRAFMIDLSLRARLHRKPWWKKHTNRSDYPTVDNPVPMGRRPTKPRPTPRKQKGKPRKRRPEWKPKKRLPTSPVEKEFQKRAEEFAAKYNVPVPRVMVGKGVMSSFYKGGFGYDVVVQKGKVKRTVVQRSEPLVFVGYAPKGKAQSEAALYHELGHHVDFWQKIRQSGGLSKKVLGSRLKQERRAWTHADPFLQTQRPVQKWMKRFTLESYRKKATTIKLASGKKNIIFE